MALVTEQLNREGIPFKTKVLSNPHQYLRADAGVLYVDQRDFGRLRPIIKQLYDDLRTGLNAPVPMFTKRLAPGLGLAEGSVSASPAAGSQQRGCAGAGPRGCGSQKRDSTL